MRSWAVLPPPPAPCPLPSRCSSSPKSSCLLLRGFHPRMGTSGTGSRATAVAGAGQSAPRRCPTTVPSQQFLSGGSIRSMSSCLMAGTSLSHPTSPCGTLPVEQPELVGAEHPAGGQELGILGIPALILLWTLLRASPHPCRGSSACWAVSGFIPG